MTNNITVDMFGGASNATNIAAADVFAGLSNNTATERIPLDRLEVSSKENDQPFDWLSYLNSTFQKTGDWRKPAERFTTFFEPVYDEKVFSVLIGACCVLGIVGNILLFICTFQDELRHHSFSVLLTAISVCDSMSLLKTSWTAIIRELHPSKAQADDNIHLCRILDLLDSWFPTASNWILVCLAIDRYIGVVHPLKRAIFCTISRARMESATVLVICFGLSIYGATRFVLLPIGKYQLCVVIDPIANDIESFNFIWAQFVPVLLLMAFSARTLWVIKTAAQNRSRIASTPNGPGNDGEILRACLSLMLFPTLSMTIILPFQVIQTYLHFAIKEVVSTGRSDLSDLNRTVFNALPYIELLYTVNFAVKMYILLATSQTYRNILRRLLRVRIATQTTVAAAAATNAGTSGTRL